MKRSNRLTAITATLLIATMGLSVSQPASAQQKQKEDDRSNVADRDAAPEVSLRYYSDRLRAAENSVTHQIIESEEPLELIVESSRILSSKKRIPRFQVDNESILAATPVSQNTIQLLAKSSGTTRLDVWDTEGKQYTIEVTVLSDTCEVEEMLRSQLPLASLQVMPLSSGAIVSGTVDHFDDVDRAMSIVQQFFDKVVNNIRVGNRIQPVLPIEKDVIEKSKRLIRILESDLATFKDLIDSLQESEH